MKGHAIRPGLTSTEGMLFASVLLLSLFRPGLDPAADLKAPPAPSVQRRVEFVQSFYSEKDAHPKRSFLNRVVDIVAGPPAFRSLVRPYSVTTDSRGRILVTDPGSLTVHIFDFKNKKYSHLEGSQKESFQSPIGIAVDGEDNIYVTDSRLGKIFVFDARGKFRRYLGEKGGEGLFKRPTGIAIDPQERRIYLSDTLYQKIFKLDFEGNVLTSFGGRGTEHGHFNFPTGVALRGDNLIVVDAMNFRVQLFDRNGNFRSTFGGLGDSTGMFNRPKGLATDSEGNIYIVEGLFETVQIFNPEGHLLLYFGNDGNGQGEFQLPSGLWVDSSDRIYVSDSYNHRVQIFQLVRNQPPGPERNP